MLVDVIQLRRLGAKLPDDEVRAAVPTRGNLQLSSARPGSTAGRRNAPLLAGLVCPGTTSWALPPLDQASVRVIRADALLLVGEQEIDQGRTYISYRQAWWCRLVLPSAPAAAVPARLVPADAWP